MITDSHDWKGDLELLNIIMIGIAENIPAKEDGYELHRLLATILSSNLEANEKLDIMKREHHIPLEDDIREEVKEMCNLSQGIKEKAYQGGYESGRESGYAEIIFKMYESGLPIEQISAITKLSEDKIKQLLKGVSENA